MINYYDVTGCCVLVIWGAGLLSSDSGSDTGSNMYGWISPAAISFSHLADAFIYFLTVPKIRKLYLPWHSWLIRVLYMEMTYHEPHTPLFPPSYVNHVNAKGCWKIGESEHNTDCDVTVEITNSYAPNICINPPMS